MRVVAIHGIGQTFEARPALETEWLHALQGGLEESGAPPLDQSEFAMVFYGALFRPPGTMRGGVPLLTAKDITDDWEKELLTAWWRGAAELSSVSRAEGGADPLAEDPSIQGPEFAGRATPEIVQRALRQLAKSKFFRAIGGERVLIFGLKQVHRFLHEKDLKQKVLDRVSERITPETRVLIGHSLGSVVAYEALCAHPEWKIDTLVTLGSPLGIPNVIFDALTPRPKNKRGSWPNVRRWHNIADRGDIVALEKQLAPFFGEVVDQLVYNGWQSHSVARYLAERITGQAVAEGL